MDKENPATLAITGNFNLTATLPQGKTIALSGYVYDGESIESVNQRLDLMFEAMERQRLRAEIPELELKREHLITQFKAMKDHLVGLNDKVASGKKLTGQEALALKNIQDNLAKVQEDIDKGLDAINEQKNKAGLI